MSVSELRELSEGELGKRLQDARQELFNLRLQPIVQLGFAQVPQFGCAHAWLSCSRWTNRVLIGSL